ncbi:MAG: hypothetical protein PHE27_03945 [Alphaproteobacteria bacterium]|nr:hypothetical protein [Alphaproteobacteria bacterium]
MKKVTLTIGIEGKKPKIAFKKEASKTVRRLPSSTDNTQKEINRCLAAFDEKAIAKKNNGALATFKRGGQDLSNRTKALCAAGIAFSMVELIEGVCEKGIIYGTLPASIGLIFLGTTAFNVTFAAFILWGCAKGYPEARDLAQTVYKENRRRALPAPKP